MVEFFFVFNPIKYKLVSKLIENRSILNQIQYTYLESSEMVKSMNKYKKKLWFTTLFCQLIKLPNQLTDNCNLIFNNFILSYHLTQVAKNQGDQQLISQLLFKTNMLYSYIYWDRQWHFFKIQISKENNFSCKL